MSFLFSAAASGARAQLSAHSGASRPLNRTGRLYRYIQGALLQGGDAIYPVVADAVRL